MKHRFSFRMTALLCALLTLTGCGASAPAPGTSTPPDPPVPPEEHSVQTLVSSGSVLKLAVRDDRPVICSLSDGVHTDLTDSPLPLPETIRLGDVCVTPFWRHQKTEAAAETVDGLDVQTVRMVFISDAPRLTYTVAFSSRPSLGGPFECTTSLQNDTADPIRYQTGTIFAARVAKPAEAPTVWAFQKESGMAACGDQFNYPQKTAVDGTGIERTVMTGDAAVTAWVNTDSDWNKNGYIPMLYVDFSGQHGVYAALEWSAGRVMAASDDADGSVSLAVDMDGVHAYKQNTFVTSVAPDETFWNPTVYLGAYSGDVDDGSNGFKRWFLACKAPANLRENPNEPLTQMDMQLNLDVDGMGIECIKWDYGWWGGSWTGGDGTVQLLEGSWELRHPAYLGVLDALGLDSMADFGSLAREKGLNWTVYLLLHDTLDENGRPTDAFGPFNSKTHPEWFTGRSVCCAAKLADLGNPDCTAYLQETLSAFFRDNNIGTWRSDFEPIAYSSIQANRHAAFGSDTQYWCTRGFLELVDYLIEHVEGFRYESCSQGGSMKDLITATRASVINCDDSANYLSLRMTFYDSSYCFHPTQLQLPCNPDTFCTGCAAHHYPHYDPAQDEAVKHMGMRSVMLGAMHLGSWCGPQNYGLLPLYTESYNLYCEKIRPLVRNGSLYHVLPRPDGIHWDGVQYADPNAETGLFGACFLFKPSEAAGDSVTVRLRGLNPDAVYRVECEDQTMPAFEAKGAVLMETGVTVTLKGVGSEILWISRP